MNTIGLVAVQVRYEQKAFWRNPASAFFTFAFPVVLFVLFGALFNGSKEAVLGGITGIEYYTPVIASYGVMSACFVNLAINTTFRRETGLLKRVRGTPLPPASYVGGAVASSVVTAAIIAVIIVAFGVLAYGSPLPVDWAGLVASMIVGAAAFCTLGLAITVIIPNADAAAAIVNLVFFVLVVISGGFFPVASTSTLAHVAEVFPFRHLVDASFAAFHPPPSGFPWWHVGVVAAWGAVGLVVCVTSFRWEPVKARARGSRARNSATRARQAA